MTAKPILVNGRVHPEELRYLQSRGLEISSFPLGWYDLKGLYRYFYRNTDALVVVVDSRVITHEWHLDEALDQMRRMFHAFHGDELEDKPVLIFCNKQDVPGALSADTISDRLINFYNWNRPWRVMPCVASTGEGLKEGFQWVRNAVNKRRQAQTENRSQQERSLLLNDRFPFLQLAPNRTTLLKKAIESGDMSWSQLPIELQTDAQFASSISVGSLGYTNIREMFLQFPKIKQDKQTWMQIIDNCNSLACACMSTTELYVLVRDLAPSDIRSEHKLMIQACQKYRPMLRLVDESLIQDRSFWKSLFQDDRSKSTSSASRELLLTIEFMPAKAQKLFPDHIAEAFTVIGRDPDFSRYSAEYLYSTITPDLWQNQWFVLSACANSSVAIDVLKCRYQSYPSRHVAWLKNYLSEAKERLHKHEACETLFLAMSQQSDCTLSLLGQGVETSLSYKERIAAYLGAPSDKEARLLRPACLNLTRALKENYKGT